MAGLQDNTLQIVLVGRTGSGKSATANTILGKRVFDSRICLEPVTKSCQCAFEALGKRKLLIVDTPGLSYTKEASLTTCEKIAKYLHDNSFAPHAIILVIKLGCFTKKDQDTLELVKAVFGEHVMKHMIVLFTGKDHLDGQMLSYYLSMTDERLKTIIKECELRCCAFDNTSADEAEKKAQVQELMELIEVMVQENGRNPTYKERLPEEEACVIL